MPGHASIVLLLGFALLVAGRPAPAIDTPGAATAGPAQGATPHVSGRLLVKFAPSVDVAVDRLVPGGSLGSALGSGRLDELNHRFGLVRTRPLRRADAALPSVAARRKAEAARYNRLSPRGAHAARPERSFASTYVFDFDLPPDIDIAELAAAYAKDPAVEWAQPDWIRHVEFVPNDPFFADSGSWGQPFGDLWGLGRIAAPVAWDSTRGAGVVIAVSDTGIDTTHLDLASNIWVNPDEVPANGIDDDANGHVDDVHGWNFVADSANVTDDHGHGTHVAGTAAAVGQNGAGVIGVAFEARVMAVKGLDAAGSGPESDLTAGILYAVENGARVINASWGGTGQDSPVLGDALNVAHAAGVVFVAAAGNSATSIDSVPFNQYGFRTFPAAFRTAIAVGATTHVDAKAPFSNFGVKIDVVAPGGGDEPPPSSFPHRSILSLKASGAGVAMTRDGELVVAGNYLRQAGTSMAAPHVSGAAALVLSRHPEFLPEQVRQALRQGADDLGASGFDLTFGYGRLNAAGAVAVDAPLVAHIASPMNHLIFADGAIDVTGSAFGPGFASYTLEYASGSAPDTWLVASGPVTTEVFDGPLGTVPIDSTPDGDLQVRLRVTSTTGAVFEDRIREFLDRIEVTSPAPYTRWRDGTIEVTGTIAPPDLQSYTVEWCDPTPCYSFGWESSGVTLTTGGTQPVTDGVLATFDLGTLPDPDRFDLRVSVVTGSGTTTHTIPNLIRDTSVRPGWSRHFIANPNTRYGVSGRISPTLADLDGDGTTEILLGIHRLVTDLPEQIRILEPDGSDRPGWPQIVPGLVSGPSAGDLDGDGLLEVVVSGRDEIFVFRHDGTAFPGWPRTFVDVGRADCTLADIDGDGVREILFRSGTHATVGAHLNAVRADGSSLPGFPVSLATSVATDVADQFAVGDVDGDGGTDIAAVRYELRRGGFGWTQGLRWLEGKWRASLVLLDSQGRMKPGWPRKVGTGDVRGVLTKPLWTVPLIADIDADGVQDVTIPTYRLGRLAAFRGDGTKIRPNLRLRIPRMRRVKNDDRHDPLIAANVTGDGAAEVVVSTDAGQVADYYDHHGTDLIGVLGRGETWEPLPGWPQSFYYVGSIPKYQGPGSVSVADINGDGVQELVLGLQHCIGWRLGPYLCNGLWAFAADGSVLPGFPKLTHAPATPYSQPAIGDLDGDGLQEIVWIGESGEVVVWNVPGTPGPPHHEWPMVRRDAAHSGALPVTP